MASSLESSSPLVGLPTEIVLDIYQHLDVSSIFNLSVTCQFLLDFFRQHKTSILLPVLAHEFAPLDELLQVYAASATDLGAGTRYTPKTIVFRRWPEDTGQLMTPNSRGNSTSGFTDVLKGRRGPAVAASQSKRVVLDERDLSGILKHCGLARKWEGLFPQMRWFYEPENCRMLRPHEGVRFRRALYRWWLYSTLFHGDQPRPRVALPEPLVEDIRTSQMRRHSTSELLELMDLVEAMRDVVLHYICPRLDPNHLHSSSQSPLINYESRDQSLLQSWNDQSSWGRILKTYAKLGPKDLMFYFENIYSYPRQRLITEIRLEHPNFTFDQESIQLAIRCALDERNWLDRSPSLAEDSVGGIIDFDDERDGERLAFGGDGSPDGTLPNGKVFMRSVSQWSPRGDDGSYLEDRRVSERSAQRASYAATGMVYTG
jgi:hypothetical protein